jgi:hypothetical protein
VRKTHAADFADRYVAGQINVIRKKRSDPAAERSWGAIARPSLIGAARLDCADLAADHLHDLLIGRVHDQQLAIDHSEVE